MVPDYEVEYSIESELIVTVVETGSETTAPLSTKVTCVSGVSSESSESLLQPRRKHYINRTAINNNFNLILTPL